MIRPLDTSLYFCAPNAVDLRLILEEKGLAVVSGIGTEQMAIELCQALGLIVPHRDSEPSGLTRIVSRSDISAADGFMGFSTNPLFPHTDRSSLREPPHLMMIVCASQGSFGGEATVVNGRILFEHLERCHPHLLAEAMKPDAIAIDDGVNRYTGPIFEALSDGSIGVRFRLDKLAVFSREIASNIELLKQIILGTQFYLPLAPKQAYVLNNRWWLHGRSCFSGSREVWRMLINWQVTRRGFQKDQAQ